MKIKAYYLSISLSIFFFFFLKKKGIDYLINLINTCKLLNATYANTRLFIDY